MSKFVPFAGAALSCAMFLGTGPAAIAGQQLALANVPTVVIQEWDKKDGSMGLSLDTQTIKAGEVTFSVSNQTAMKMKHEVLVIPNPKDLAELKLEANGSKVDEEKLEGLNEVGESEPGESTVKTISLKPGTYLVFCNQPGHFAAGMHQVLTVTP